MNPNHYLAVAIGYLFGGARPRLAATTRAIGKTLVSSSMIDRVAGRPRPAAGRGAGRLQVVRARAARRLGRLRRRGVGRRVVPAPRRLGLDHRQGRHPPGPAGLGDPRRRPGKTPERALRRAGRAARRPGLRPDRRRRPTASRRPSSAALSPDDVTADRRWPASRSPPSSPRRPATAPTIGGLKVTTENAWFAARPSRHRGRLQDLRRVVPRPRPPRPGAGRGQGGRLRRPRRLSARRG